MSTLRPQVLESSEDDFYCPTVMSNSSGDWQGQRRPNYTDIGGASVPLSFKYCYDVCKLSEGTDKYCRDHSTTPRDTPQALFRAVIAVMIAQTSHQYLLMNEMN